MEQANTSGGSRMGTRRGASSSSSGGTRTTSSGGSSLQRRSTSGGSSLERLGGLRRPGEVVARDDRTKLQE